MLIVWFSVGVRLEAIESSESCKETNWKELIGIEVNERDRGGKEVL